MISIALAFSGCDRTQENASPQTNATAPSSADGASKPEPSDQPATPDPSATCEQAYADLEELVKGLEEQLGPSDAGMPERDAFIEKCQTLPTDVQECMVFEYGMANKEECEDRVSALAPEERRRAQELMGR